MFLFKSSCPFLESLDVIFFPKWTCGLQGNQTICLCHVTAQHVLAGSSAAAQALPPGPVLSNTQIAVLTVVSTLCYRTDDLLEKTSTKFDAPQFCTSAFCWPQVSYQDVIISPLVIVSVINIQLQLMNFIMKTLCPPESITDPKDLFFFFRLHLFCFSA